MSELRWLRQVKTYGNRQTKINNNLIRAGVHVILKGKAKVNNHNRRHQTMNDSTMNMNIH